MGEVRDFSRDREDIKFKIDGDLFTAAPAIPAQVMLDFASRFSAMDENSAVDEQLRAFAGVLKLVLVPRSHKLFVERMADITRPIDIEQVEQVIEWLFEKYGMRPTPLPSDSADGQLSPASGISSTGNTPVVVSISPGSLSTGF